MESLQVKSNGRVQFVDITSRVRDTIAKSGVRDGFAVVFVPHTTAGITINEAADPAGGRRHKRKVGQTGAPFGFLSPHGRDSDAHIKATMVGSSVHITFPAERRCWGPGKGIFFCEFDAPGTEKSSCR